MITWSCYEYNYKCYCHGHIGRNSQCTKCEELPPEQRPTKKPQSKLEQVQKRAPIGEFWDHCKQFIIDKYQQHRWLLRALGSGTVGDSRGTQVGCCPLMVLAFAVGEITVTG
jgi:hypothetical protein